MVNSPLTAVVEEEEKDLETTPEKQQVQGRISDAKEGEVKSPSPLSPKPSSKPARKQYQVAVEDEEVEEEGFQNGNEDQGDQHEEKDRNMEGNDAPTSQEDNLSWDPNIGVSLLSSEDPHQHRDSEDFGSGAPSAEASRAPDHQPGNAREPRSEPAPTQTETAKTHQGSGMKEDNDGIPSIQSIWLSMFPPPEGQAPDIPDFDSHSPSSREGPIPSNADSESKPEKQDHEVHGQQSEAAPRRRSSGLRALERRNRQLGAAGDGLADSASPLPGQEGNGYSDARARNAMEAATPGSQGIGHGVAFSRAHTPSTSESPLPSAGIGAASPQRQSPERYDSASLKPRIDFSTQYPPSPQKTHGIVAGTQTSPFPSRSSSPVLKAIHNPPIEDVETSLQLPQKSSAIHFGGFVPAPYPSTYPKDAQKLDFHESARSSSPFTSSASTAPSFFRVKCWENVAVPLHFKHGIDIPPRVRSGRQLAPAPWASREEVINYTEDTIKLCYALLHSMLDCVSVQRDVQQAIQDLRSSMLLQSEGGGHPRFTSSPVRGLSGLIPNALDDGKVACPATRASHF